MLEAEQTLMPLDGVQSYFTSTASGQQGGMRGGNSTPVDQIGMIFMEMDGKAAGTTGWEILEEARRKLAPVAGITTEIAEQEYGPPVGKDIQIQVASKYREDLEPAVTKIRDYLESVDGLRDIEDTRELPGIEWVLEVDRAKAAQFNVNINEVGAAVQLVTNGIYLR